MSTDLFAAKASPLTMSSREIAEVTGKDHRNVTRDIEKMLNDVGEGVLKFEQTYTNAQNGQSYREFLIPKDLTITLVAGYRSDLRLKIVRRWMELETGGNPVAVSSAPQPKLAGMGRTFADMRRIAKLMKLDDAQAAIHASHAVERLHGVNPLEVMDIKRIESPAQKAFFTVSDLAKREGWQSAQWLNRTLLAMGLQDRSGNDDNPWTATEAGRAYSRLEDAPIKGRRSRQMLLWSAEIIPLVKQHIAQSATPYAAVTAAEDAVLVEKGA
ncbi:Rha family transcriptional regulator [Gluconobacter oxydans]|uniref:Rha family transcriptional regulator n=1 Tax=Gluconobacter oxydans TaxID=442 RepID=UPI0039EC61C7